MVSHRAYLGNQLGELLPAVAFPTGRGVETPLHGLGLLSPGHIRASALLHMAEIFNHMEKVQNLQIYEKR